MDVTVQLVAYTAERLLAAPWITIRTLVSSFRVSCHVNSPLLLTLAHIFVLPDRKLYLWWYDKQHCLQSNGINFFDSLPHFVVLIMLFQCLESQHWGLADRHHDNLNASNSCSLETQRHVELGMFFFYVILFYTTRMARLEMRSDAFQALIIFLVLHSHANSFNAGSFNAGSLTNLPH